MREAWRLATAVSGLLRAASASLPVWCCPILALAAAREPAAVLRADIPAEPLAQALSALADQTGLQLVYLSDLLHEQRAPAVAAGTPVREALLRLLKGTGLQFEYLTPDSVRIVSPAAPIRQVSAITQGPFEDIVVSANRRDEAMQNVPITMEVLTGTSLLRLNATTFDDFLSYLPTMTAHGVGPAQNNIFVRGLSTGDYPNQAAGTNGVFPNVAIYLDEQSAQLPGRNLDVYAVDLDRIEVLEGPQGTLFGAGAQAGVLRYITNHPKLNVTEGSVTAGTSMTAHGAPSSAISAVLNLPLIADRLAVRGVIYNERRGGYIDNTPATFARAASDRSISYANYPAGCGEMGPVCQVPPNSVVLNNSALVASDFNPVSYQGLRLQALLQLDDDWSVLLAQYWQTMEADGVFAEEAVNSVGEAQRALTVQLFNPSYNKDRFENTAITVAGRIGTLKVLYAGSYLVRNVEQSQDYTNYARGGFYADYYQCVNPAASASTARCFSPSSVWRDHERNTHLSQELRVSTPDEWRIRGLAGLYYEDYKIHDQGDWYYETALAYFNRVGVPTTTLTDDLEFVPGHPVTANNPQVRPPGDAFFNDSTRGYTQKAAFASLDVDLIPRVLSFTAGTRYFDTYDTEVGAEVSSFGCRLYDNPISPPPNPCVNHSFFVNLDALGLARSYTGFRSRANLSWKPGDNVLLYYTWSQGFRAGGFNRASQLNFTSPLYPGGEPFQAVALMNHGWTPPRTYAPDNLVNNEVGWKVRWLDQRLEWTGALYQEDWLHAQYALDAALLGGATLNGGNYRVRGLEMSVRWRVADGLTVEAGGAWNHSELVKEAAFYWVSGKLIDFNVLKTVDGQPLSNPAGVLGSPLAAAPAARGNLRARYERALGGYLAFAQLGAMYQSGSLATTDRLGLDIQGTHTAYSLPPFASYDAAFGVGRDAWQMQVNGENLSDKRAHLYENYSLNYQATTISRPRTIGLRLSYRFGGE